MRPVLFAAILFAAFQSRAITQPRRLLSIEDSVETRRLLKFDGGDDGICLAPDGKRYLFATAKGDVARDGLWVDIFAGLTGSLESAEPERVTQLFTHALGNMAVTLENRFTWLDSRHVTFLWQDEQGARQLVQLDLQGGSVQLLTHHPGGVLQHAVSEHNRVVLYTAFAPHDDSISQRLRREGFAVRGISGMAFLEGRLDDWNPWDHVELFVVPGTGLAPARINLPSGRGAGFSPSLSIAPDGRFGLIVSPTDRAPPEWDRYTEPFWRFSVMPALRGKGDLSKLEQLYLVDIQSGSVRPLWNAPWSRAVGTTVRWTADGRSVIVGPTFTPPDVADAAGLAAQAVVEITIPDGVFRIVSKPAAVRASMERPVRIHVRQDLNNSPQLFAVDPKSRTSRAVFDLNPDLRSAFLLGRVELIRWKDVDGRQWGGRLYYPVNYQKGRRYPLVIQTHGYSRDEFSLIGDDRFPSVFAAQVLAGRQIAVLQMGDPEASDDKRYADRTSEGKVYLNGFISAIQHLSALSLVDAHRVGLSGFSRTGWHVEYALAHSAFPFAAALAADNIDAGYLQSLLIPEWASSFSESNGGEPFGDGLMAWIKEAPAFNAQDIRTPLRLQVNSGSVFYAMTHWELYSRLRQLGRPVELYVVPNIEAGTHNLQNPAQVVASAGGAVDWFDFWLNGHQDAAPGKTEQYARWRELRER